MSRITIEVTPEQHQQVKAMAAMQGQSIKDFIIERLFPTDSEEERAWSELKSLLSDRIARAENGQFSGKTFQQVLDNQLADWENV